MFVLVVLLNLLLCYADEDFGTNLVASLRNDANLDMSIDEEYEDLRAELLAYHTALATLSSKRRSMISTPCWTLGGICVNYKLCTGFRYLTEVPGCKDRLTVCCFAWNKYKVKDWRDKGLGTLALPWSEKFEFGGLGVISKDDKNKDESQNNLSENSNEQQQSAVGENKGEKDFPNKVGNNDEKNESNVKTDEENKNIEFHNNAKHSEYDKVNFLENKHEGSVEIDEIQLKDEITDKAIPEDENYDDNKGIRKGKVNKAVKRNERNKLGKVKKKAVALILHANK